jgi:hypothetical protein
MRQYLTFAFVLLRFVVLHCAVLCCAVLCCAVLCCSVLCCVAVLKGGFSAAYESIREELHTHLRALSDEYEAYRTDAIQRAYERVRAQRRLRREQRRLSITAKQHGKLQDGTTTSPIPAPSASASAASGSGSSAAAHKRRSGLRHTHIKRSITSTAASDLTSSVTPKPVSEHSSALAKPALHHTSSAPLTLSAEQARSYASLSEHPAKVPLVSGESSDSASAGAVGAVSSTYQQLAISIHARDHTLVSPHKSADGSEWSSSDTDGEEDEGGADGAGGGGAGAAEEDKRDGGGGGRRGSTSWSEPPPEALARVQPLQVYLTGHSLGGALATLCAYECVQVFGFANVSLYNFGTPRVGDRVFAAAYDERVPLSFRVVYDRDMISSIPKMVHRTSHHIAYHDPASNK